MKCNLRRSKSDLLICFWCNSCLGDGSYSCWFLQSITDTSLHFSLVISFGQKLPQPQWSLGEEDEGGGPCPTFTMLTFVYVESLLPVLAVSPCTYLNCHVLSLKTSKNVIKYTQTQTVKPSKHIQKCVYYIYFYLNLLLIINTFENKLHH